MVWRHCEHNKLSLRTITIRFNGPTNIPDVIEDVSLRYENIWNWYTAALLFKTM